VRSGGDKPRAYQDSNAIHRIAGSLPGVALTLPSEALELIARRAAELVLERLKEVSVGGSPFLSVAEAADYLRAKSRQRVYDLLSAGRLTRYKDGRRVLVSRAELDAYLTGAGRSPVAPAWPHLPRGRSSKGLAA
jgi:excisionase family DNA binding protein